LHLRNARFRDAEGVIEPGCDCAACSGGFSLAYLRHLFLAGEMLGGILVSLHNIRHFQRLMLDIRRAIREDSWESLDRGWPVLQSPERPGQGQADSAAPAGQSILPPRSLTFQGPSDPCSDRTQPMRATIDHV